MSFLITHWHCILPIALIGFFVYINQRESKVHKGDYNGFDDEDIS